MPVGKEMIRYEDEENEWEEAEALGQPRPGTTKRKQYYLKRVANSLLGRPMPGCKAYLYKIQMTLSCPITEEQNTRGRRIYAPEESVRGFGLLCENFIPLVCLFFLMFSVLRLTPFTTSVPFCWLNAMAFSPLKWAEIVY